MISAEKSRKWLAIAFAGSLALNFFQGGVMTGRFLYAPSIPMPGPPDIKKIEVVLDRLTAGMSEEDQRTIQSVFRRRQPGLMAKVEEARSSRARIMEILLADPVDRNAFQAAADELELRQKSVMAEMNHLIREVVPELSIDGRRRFVDFVGRHGPD